MPYQHCPRCRLPSTSTTRWSATDPARAAASSSPTSRGGCWQELDPEAVRVLRPRGALRPRHRRDHEVTGSTVRTAIAGLSIPLPMFQPDVAAGVHRIEDAHTNLYLVEDGDRVTVVDAGVPPSWESLVSALGGLGRGPPVAAVGHPRALRPSRLRRAGALDARRAGMGARERRAAGAPAAAVHPPAQSAALPAVRRSVAGARRHDARPGVLPAGRPRAAPVHRRGARRPRASARVPTPGHTMDTCAAPRRSRPGDRRRRRRDARPLHGPRPGLAARAATADPIVRAPASTRSPPRARGRSSAATGSRGATAPRRSSRPRALLRSRRRGDLTAGPVAWLTAPSLRPARRDCARGSHARQRAAAPRRRGGGSCEHAIAASRELLEQHDALRASVADTLDSIHRRRATEAGSTTARPRSRVDRDEIRTGAKDHSADTPAGANGRTCDTYVSHSPGSGGWSSSCPVKPPNQTAPMERARRDARTSA